MAEGMTCVHCVRERRDEAARAEEARLNQLTPEEAKAALNHIIMGSSGDTEAFVRAIRKLKATATPRS